MEYERIDKVQSGIISPSKLRMKFMGSPNQRKKDGSNSNSSRTSPARLDDSEFVNNSLLASTADDWGIAVHSLEDSSVTTCSQSVSNSLQSGKEKNGDSNSHGITHQFSRSDSVNSSAVHPLKSMEDENLDYDSNASSSSFEFHKGERAARSLTRSFSRPTSYKWNDAEKWIVSKQGPQCNYPKGQSVQPQGNRMSGLNMVRVAPEAAGYDYRAFPHGGAQSNCLANLYPQTKDLKEVIPTQTLTDDSSGNPAIREVSMRDMGTEMTPVPSQEPSRTGTPVGATTPLRSPISSLPSTPRRGDTAASTKEHDKRSHGTTENGKRGLSEQEQKLKTRREIVALGVRLGKTNIAAWASKEEQEKSVSDLITDQEDQERLEYEKRAAAWEEAEKSRHAARFMREEIKIEAWESQQKLKLEEEMRRIEAKVEEMRAHAQAKMMKKVAMARRRSDEKRLAAETRKNRQAEKTAAQAETIRQTGRIPPSNYICCGLVAYSRSH